MIHIRLLACLATLGALLLTPCSRAEEPFFAGGFKDACTNAAKAKRVVLVDFYTTWCLPCRKLDQTTWKNKAVLAWLEDHCVCLKVDAEKEEGLAKRFKIAAYPTILLLKPDGSELDRLVGYRSPAAFLSEAKDALAGKDSITRAKDKLVGKNKDNPRLRMAYGDALVQRGRHGEAFKEYVWCLENCTKLDPGFPRQALYMQIHSLAQDHEPAMKLLKDRSAAARAAIVAGKASDDDIEDFGFINRIAEKPEENLKLFDELRAKKAKNVGDFFEQVVDLLIEKRRYRDVVDVGGDFTVRVREMIDAIDKVGKGSKLGKDTLRALKDDLLKEAGKYYEALVATDEMKKANALRDQLLAFDGGVTTYATLIRHARRGKKEKVVQALLSTAKAKLSAEEFKRAQEAK